nr:adenylate kinase isoenzyme 1-like isoform X1 [Loxodonta africana]
MPPGHQGRLGTQDAGRAGVTIFIRGPDRGREFAKVTMEKLLSWGCGVRKSGAPDTEFPLPPQGVILDLVSDNLLSRPESRGFVIDGFPRELKQAKEFERIVGQAPNMVIVFDCSMETMVQRVLRRRQLEHRVDDCEAAVRQRLDAHYSLCQPVLTFYQQKNLLRNILAEETPENIFVKCCSVIESLQ